MAIIHENQLSGWFGVGFSSDIPQGGVYTTQFFGGELVLYRTESNDLYAIEPHCPHLGAHIGRGGHVEGENIVCPFHGFKFDTEGHCVHSYDNGSPCNGCLKHRPLKEVCGTVFIWHGQDLNVPEWELPTWDDKGWTQLYTFQKVLTAHQENVIENIIDFGHLGPVHHGLGAKALSDYSTEGPVASMSYEIQIEDRGIKKALEGRFGFLLKSWLEKRLVNVITFDFKSIGLGCNFVEFTTDSPVFKGWTFREIIMPTPSIDDQLDYRFGIQFYDANPQRSALSKLLFRLFLPFVAKRSFEEVHQEFYIWENQEPCDKPMLAKGDGPIIQYRRWIQQFKLHSEESETLKGITH